MPYISLKMRGNSYMNYLLSANGVCIFELSPVSLRAYGAFISLPEGLEGVSNPLEL